ncbi:hypothetical protein FQN52_003618 [Onygenales sp. PD_12]|nr:hypothetical protein FQN52_003618 [Onygenales sp. PD_12]
MSDNPNRGSYGYSDYVAYQRSNPSSNQSGSQQRANRPPPSSEESQSSQSSANESRTESSSRGGDNNGGGHQENSSDSDSLDPGYKVWGPYFKRDKSSHSAEDPSVAHEESGSRNDGKTPSLSEYFDEGESPGEIMIKQKQQREQNK